MHFSLKLLSLLIGALLLAGNLFGQAPPQHVQDALVKLAGDALQSDRANGAVIQVVMPGEWTWDYAIGDANLDPYEEATPDMKFRAASITKNFITTALLMEVQNGKLSLDDLLSKHLRPSLIDSIPNGKTVKVRHLLQHTSGIPDYLNQNQAFALEWFTNLSRIYSRSHIIGIIDTMGAMWPAGTRFSYSNSNFYIAALLLEQVSGQTQDAYIKQHIVDKLGLTHTNVPLDNELDINGPHLHCLVDTTGRGAFADFTLMSPSAMFGAGSLITNTADLNKYFHALRTGTLVADTLVAAILNTSVDMGAGARYGLGEYLYMLNNGDSLAYGHGGNLPGVSSGMFYLPGVDAHLAFSMNVTGKDGFQTYIVPMYILLQKLATVLSEAGYGKQALTVFPNPATERFNVAFALSHAGRYRLDLMDLSGRVVRTLTDEDLAAGPQQLTFERGSLTGGAYLVRLTGDGSQLTQKLLLGQ